MHILLNCRSLQLVAHALCGAPLVLTAGTWAACCPAERSHALIDQLKAKRFKQIFDFLDEAGTGSVPLARIVAGDNPEVAARLEELDNEVRQDLEGAARVFTAITARK